MEDDPDAAFLMQRVIKKVSSAWRVDLVGDGVAAVDHVLDHGLPILLITDLQMPRMDGYELIAWVRTQPKEKQPPILVVSGSLDAQTMRRCRSLGADDFIPKQSCLEQLEDRLRQLLSSS